MRVRHSLPLGVHCRGHFDFLHSHPCTWGLVALLVEVLKQAPRGVLDLLSGGVGLLSQMPLAH